MSQSDDPFFRDHQLGYLNHILYPRWRRFWWTLKSWYFWRIEYRRIVNSDKDWT